MDMMGGGLSSQDVNIVSEEGMTYPSADCPFNTFVSCCVFDEAASPKSKNWPKSEALGVAIVLVCQCRPS